MATEVCDCGGTCNVCNPTFHPQYIEIEVKLFGKKGEDCKIGTLTYEATLWNEAVARFVIADEPLTKKRHSEIVRAIAKAIKVKPCQVV